MKRRREWPAQRRARVARERAGYPGPWSFFGIDRSFWTITPSKPLTKQMIIDASMIDLYPPVE